MMPSKGKPSQAAIVEFAEISEARWVVENLNGNIPQGLSEPVTVNFKRERQSSKGFGKDGGYGKMGGKGFSKGGKGKGKSPY
mmetsp:Transcript_19852/g.45217  ORF Transcript_19852/g.45217 Transcript_19852/m.45217 type:complete len:82 (-) Transcript_19852:37-282(-)